MVFIVIFAALIYNIMNREIKFRAWVVNDSGEEMCYSKDTQINSPIALALQYAIGYEDAYPDKNDIKDWQKNIVFMQYTGLKDKNGVEIYEGDILEIKASWGTYKAIVKYGLIGKDGEQHAAFGYYIPNEDGEEESYYLTLIDIFTSNEVVVGNIYENSELLK